MVRGNIFPSRQGSESDAIFLNFDFLGNSDAHGPTSCSTALRKFWREFVGRL
jgi:hypothetical protein